MALCDNCGGTVLATVRGESFTVVSAQASEVLKAIYAVPTEVWREYHEQRDYYTSSELQEVAEAVLLLRGEKLGEPGLSR